jgi:hypothetical protein
MQALGVSLKDSDGNVRDMNDIFPEMVMSLQNVEDVTSRNAIAQQIFGRSMKDIAPVLGMTSEELSKARKEAHDLNLVMSEDSLKAANNFRVSMEGLRAQFTAVFREMAARLIPVLEKSLLPVIRDELIPMIVRFGEKVGEAASWFNSLSPGAQNAATKIALFTAAAGPALIVIGKMISSIRTVITTIKLLNAALLTNPFTLIGVAVAAATIKLVGMRAEIDRLNKAAEDRAAVKRAEEQKKVLTELLPLYKNLADAASGKDVFGSEQEIRDAIDRTKELEQQTEALGITLSGVGFKGANIYERQLAQVRQALTDLGDSTGEADAATAELTASYEKFEQLLKKITSGAKGTGEAVSAAAKLGAEWATKLREQGASEIELNEMRRKAAIAAAQQAEASADTISTINKFYDNEAERIHKAELERQKAEIEAQERKAQSVIDSERDILAAYKEAQRQKDAAAQAGTDLQNFLIQEETSAAIGAAQQIMSLALQVTQRKITLLEQERARQISVAQSTITNEEQRAAAVQQINVDADAKKRELILEQAKREKAAAIFSAIINTATAVSKALTLGVPGLILAGIFAALGIAQIALIASEPLPQMADGGLVKSTQGGVPVVTAEAGQDELIMPLDKGIDALLNGISKRMDSDAGKRRSLPAALTGSPSSSTSRLGGAAKIMQVGTLVASPSSLRDLERRQYKVRVPEQRRKGILNAA